MLFKGRKEGRRFLIDWYVEVEINSMELTWEAISNSESQVFPNILRNPKVYHPFPNPD
jgi:hypothetical protein